MKTLKFKMIGIGHALTHNSRLANPRDQFAKALKLLSAKRPKTEADQDEMSRLDFLGGLYVGEDKQVVMPDNVLYSTILAGAKASKNGQKIKSGMFVNGSFKIKHKFSGKTPDELFKEEECVDIRSVKVCQARVMRTRMKLIDWSVDVSVDYDETVINTTDLKQAIKDAGKLKGVFDNRPQNGRFSVKFA